MKNKFIAVLELDADIDDIIAYDYLHQNDALQGVVLDPYPKSEIGLKRLEQVKKRWCTSLWFYSKM